MVYIYTIKLTQGKYYIGKTNNPYFRLEEHFNSNGSEWTKKYKPIKVIEILSNCDDYDEDKITRKYMDKYGINNVRGGSFVSLKLKKSTIDTLIQMSNGTNNKCFVCGKKGHYANNCEQNTNTFQYDDYEDSDNYEDSDDSDNDSDNYEDSEDFEDSDDSDDSYKNNSKCFRCGRKGHFVSSCFASKHIKGYYLK